MMIPTFFRIFALCLLGTAALATPLERRDKTSWSPTCSPNVSFTTSDFQSRTVDNYLALWAGNYSLLNVTLSPGVGLYQDRLPYGVEQIQNSSAFLGWIEHSRFGWDTYEFKTWYWFGSSYKIAIRWYLDGVIRNVSAHAPGSPLPPGSRVSYNGTDILTIDPCTGLIDEVDSSQDFLDYFWALELKNITLRG